MATKLERSGIELVLQGLNTYNSGLAKAEAANQKWGKSLEQMAKHADKLALAFARVTTAEQKTAQARARARQEHERTLKAVEATRQAETKLAQAVAQSQAKQVVSNNQVVKAKLDLQRTIATLPVQEQRAANQADAILQKHAQTALQTAQYVSQSFQQFFSGIGLPNVGNMFSGLLGLTSQASQFSGMAGPLAGIATAISSIGSKVAPVLAILSTLATVAKTAFNIVLNAAKTLANFIKNVLVGAFNLLKSVVSSLLSPFTSLIHSWAAHVAAGVLLRDMIRAIIDAIRNLATEMTTVIGSFQRLQIQFESLSARDISKELGIGMAEAFDLASERAAKLFAWTAKIAVTTPYTVQDVSRTLAMANAMGLNIGAAQALTKSTMNFASAMGLEEEAMYRIIYNFGQIESMGKITGREIRDLTTSFVPMHRIMQEMADDVGKTRQEFEELALTGKVAPEEFFKKFIEVVERDFPEAAKKMARTLTGVKNNLIDFFQAVVGVNVLKPGFDKITELMANALEKLLSPEIRQKAFEVGQIIAKGLDYVFPAIDYLVTSIQIAINTILKYFGLAAPTFQSFAQSIAFAFVLAGRVISKFAEWIQTAMTTQFPKLAQYAGKAGAKISEFFAKGIIAGINFIIKAITMIANIVSSLFKSKSPPKILPDIDKWGTATMQSWVDGFLEADFSVIQDASKDIESNMGALASNVAPAGAVVNPNPPENPVGWGVGGLGQPKPTAPKPPSVNVLGLYKKYGAEAFTKFLQGWKEADFNIFNDITSTISSYLRSLPEEIMPKKSLIETILGTREAVAKAINGIRSGAITVSDAIEGIMKSAKKLTGAFKDYIRSLFEVERATKIYADAQKRVKDIEDAISKTTDKYSKILEGLNKQLDRLTEVYDENQRLKEIDAAIGTGLLTAEEHRRLELEKQTIGIKRQIRSVEDARDAELGVLETALEEAKVKEEAARIDLENKQKQLDATKALIDVQTDQNELVGELVDILKQAAEAAAAAAKAAEDAAESFSEWSLPFEEIPLPEMPDLASIFAQAEADVDAFLKNIETNWNTFWTQFDTKPAEDAISQAWKNVETWWNTQFIPAATLVGVVGVFWFGELARTWKDFTDAVTGPSGESTKLSLANITGILLLLGGVPGANILGFFRGLIEAIDEFKTHGEAADKAASQFSTDITTFFNNIATTVGDAWDLLFGDGPETLSGKFERFKNDIDALKRDIEALWGDLWRYVDEKVHEKLDPLIEFFTTWIGEAVKLFEGLYNTLIGQSIIPEMLTAIEKAFTDKLTAVKTWIDENFIQPVVALFDSLLDPVTGLGAKALTIAKGIYDSFYDTISELPGALQGFFDTIGKALKAIWDKILQILGKKDEIEAEDKLQGGGPVTAHHTYLVGERGPELFSPSLSGHIIPNSRLNLGADIGLIEAIRELTSAVRMAAMIYRETVSAPARYSPQMAGGSSSYDQRVFVEVNPTYRNVESPSSIYYDVRAALEAAKR